MGLFLDYAHTDLFARMETDPTDLLYNFLPEVVEFTLTLGFASCVPDRTDKQLIHTFAVPGMSQPYAWGSQKISEIRTNQ